MTLDGVSRGDEVHVTDGPVREKVLVGTSVRLSVPLTLRVTTTDGVGDIDAVRACDVDWEGVGDGVKVWVGAQVGECDPDGLVVRVGATVGDQEGLVEYLSVSHPLGVCVEPVWVVDGVRASDPDRVWVPEPDPVGPREPVEERNREAVLVRAAVSVDSVRVRVWPLRVGLGVGDRV